MTLMSDPDDIRCTSLSEDGRRCRGDLGHDGTHWAAASRVWSDTETLVRPPPTLARRILALCEAADCDNYGREAVDVGDLRQALADWLGVRWDDDLNAELTNRETGRWA